MTMSSAIQQTSLSESQVNELVNSKVSNDTSSNEWTNFIPPEQISLSHPWLARYHQSAILKHTTGSDLISTVDKEIYGDDKHSIAFRIGNGGAGYTSVIEALSLEFIQSHGSDFRIAWVANHSRHSQAALLADVVQVALTYEPDVEELAVREGWCRRVCTPAFWDHFILVGPDANPARVDAGCEVREALERIMQTKALFHTRGDGSATFEKEQMLWRGVGIDSGEAEWVQTHAIPPYPALEKADKDGAHLLTDRATFLTAKKDRMIPRLVVYVEGKEELLNPCSALINTKVPDSSKQRLAIRFAEWLAEEPAQSILRSYGRDWNHGMPLFTEAARKEFGDEETLAGRNL